MMPRSSTRRKYRPAFEALERKQLLSAGPPTFGLEALGQATAPVSSQVANEQVGACGTGTGTIIITS
jgi:hypothetical protein